MWSYLSLRTFLWWAVNNNLDAYLFRLVVADLVCTRIVLRRPQRLYATDVANTDSSSFHDEDRNETWWILKITRRRLSQNWQWCTHNAHIYSQTTAASVAGSRQRHALFCRLSGSWAWLRRPAVVGGHWLCPCSRKHWDQQVTNALPAYSSTLYQQWRSQDFISGRARSDETFNAL